MNKCILPNGNKLTKILLLGTVVMSVFLQCFANSNKYAKLFKLTDSDLSSFISDLTTVPPKRMRSLFQCTAYASQFNKRTNMAHRNSAFKYVNETCSLARTPPFIDDIIAREVITDGSPGYHVMLNKPKALEVHSDLLFFILINEEKIFLNHRDLGTPNPAHYDDGTKYFNFDQESPVKTLEGHFAGTPVNSAYLSYSLDNPLEISALSMGLWYYPGSMMDETLVILYTYNPSGSYFALRVGTSSKPGSLQINRKVMTEANVITSSIWHYLTCTYKPSTGEITLYTNGTFTASGIIQQFNLTVEVVDIGQSYSNGKSYPLTGYVSSVEIYDRILTEAEVMESFKKSTTTRVQSKFN